MELGTRFDILLLRYGVLPEDLKSFCERTLENAVCLSEREQGRRMRRAIKRGEHARR